MQELNCSYMSRCCGVCRYSPCSSVRGSVERSEARGFISAMATGTPRGTELRKLFPVGKELEVKIIEMDPRRGEVKLSIKALNEETERNAYQTYRAQVKREAKFGTLADRYGRRRMLSA